MSAPMTMKELGDLLNHIFMDHSFCRAFDGLRHVKYIYPNIDSRTWHCFAIKFRGGSTDEVVLHTQNECRDLPVSLYERCMKWLDGADDVNAYRRSDLVPCSTTIRGSLTEHAQELSRNAEKVGRPAGDIPAVMHAAAAHIEDLERKLREAEARVAELEAERAELDKQEPVFWYLPLCHGGMYEGPFLVRVRFATPPDVESAPERETPYPVPDSFRSARGR